MNFGKTETVSYQSFEQHRVEVLGFGLKVNADYFLAVLCCVSSQRQFWGLFIQTAAYRKISFTKAN